MSKKTQEEQKVNCKQQQLLYGYWKIENGNYPSEIEMQAIANVFGVSRSVIQEWFTKKKIKKRKYKLASPQALEDHERERTNYTVFATPKEKEEFHKLVKEALPTTSLLPSTEDSKKKEKKEEEKKKKSTTTTRIKLTPHTTKLFSQYYATHEQLGNQEFRVSEEGIKCMEEMKTQSDMSSLLTLDQINMWCKNRKLKLKNSIFPHQDHLNTVLFSLKKEIFKKLSVIIIPYWFRSPLSFLVEHEFAYEQFFNGVLPSSWVEYIIKGNFETETEKVEWFENLISPSNLTWTKIQKFWLQLHNKKELFLMKSFLNKYDQEYQDLNLLLQSSICNPTLLNLFIEHVSLNSQEEEKEEKEKDKIWNSTTEKPKEEAWRELRSLFLIYWTGYLILGKLQVQLISSTLLKWKEEFTTNLSTEISSQKIYDDLLVFSRLFLETFDQEGLNEVEKEVGKKMVWEVFLQYITLHMSTLVKLLKRFLGKPKWNEKIDGFARDFLIYSESLQEEWRKNPEQQEVEVEN